MLFSVDVAVVQLAEWWAALEWTGSLVSVRGDLLPARLRIPTDCTVQVGMQVLTGVELARPRLAALSVRGGGQGVAANVRAVG